MSEKSEKCAREIEKIIEDAGLSIDGGVLRDILEEELGGDATCRSASENSGDSKKNLNSEIASNTAPTSKPKARWHKSSYNEWILIAPCKVTDNNPLGTYEIHVVRRPSYCDRGDWIIYMDGYRNDIDGADGFPRYFFGTEDEAKTQMETWLNRRKCYREAIT